MERLFTMWFQFWRHSEKGKTWETVKTSGFLELGDERYKFEQHMEFLGQWISVCDTIKDTYHYTFVQMHRMYTKSEL